MAPKTTTARPSLSTLSVRVTGFEFMYASFHAYTTVVTVQGASWSLGIRYSKFLSFYEALKATERSFKFDFPPRGGIFSKPKPEDRQVRLDAFLQAVTKFYQVKKQPPNVAKLLCEFLQVDRNYTRANKFQIKRKNTETPAAKVVSVSKATLSEMAEDGKMAQVNVATVVIAGKDSAVDATKGDKNDLENKYEEKKSEDNEVRGQIVGESKIENKKKTEETKDTENKIEKKNEENKIEKKIEVIKAAEQLEKEENIANEKKASKQKSEMEKEEMPEEAKITVDETFQAEIEEVKPEQNVEESKVEVKNTWLGKEEVAKTSENVSKAQDALMSKEKMDEEKKIETVKFELVKDYVEEETLTKTEDALIAGATTTTTTMTTAMGSTVVETNVISQPSANKTVVDKTVTITTKSDDEHSFKVEMTENKASVVTLMSALEQVVDDELKQKKKKRSGRRKSVSSAPASTGSTSTDGFESPDGVDQLGCVTDPSLTEAQKKARNQRRKEKRKKNQKRLQSSDLKQ
ncbi:Phox homologous domain [Plasmopara halstedii]|uniref:Phox homologous domain n=1 Tax=Plasmopara halstedii TaxID=4781 RepID=A0A0P1AYX8_PLAHL|nr:Phox homologous domain [Plasmopara halstedii]CEG47496.1 Phox homologous domain [Plasmopara halstedii]|eukprot:XP_024583865.1 Phox homologous domain [Plasmopara halstedii]